MAISPVPSKARLAFIPVKHHNCRPEAVALGDHKPGLECDRFRYYGPG